MVIYQLKWEGLSAADLLDWNASNYILPEDSGEILYFFSLGGIPLKVLDLLAYLS
jgi:hypothetical protein